MDRTAWLADGRHVDTAAGRIWWRLDERAAPSGAPTLLFLHGFPTSSHDWADIIAALAPRFRCLTLDLLGFGASAKPRIAYRYAHQRAAAEAVLAASATTSVILVAHDYGVTLGQLLLAAPPPGCAIAGAIFLNGGLEPALHRPRPIQRFLASRLGVALGPALLGRRSFERSLRQVVTRAERLDFAALWEGVEDGDGRHALPRLLAYMAERRDLRPTLLAALTDATVPLGFAWGLEDPISGAHMLAWARAACPRAEVLALPGVGHYPQLEAREEVTAWIGELAERWVAQG